eukprot:CAMPEP_0202961588 /NCGR_PEP_ID=MMETSP1396-20130829/5649_1 /ASSEMBLY_ACC=CAM_ASM_000872 /TAXON_ID= /ORGANISM="Pseudokeronopsis sp., Strain Brazil" /LENGTH=124 /DNA_ID=CAMNT_0049681517 /DNA_START=30 /DNA_END=404 /DNA_ORIENTATION=-
MASVDIATLSKQEHDELVCSYAALLLHDDGQEISADKLAKVIKASGNEVEGFWPSMFASALKGQNVEELISNLASAAPVAVAVGATAGGPAPVAAAAAKEEKKEAAKEEEADVDMGGLFGGDEY